MGKRLKAKKEGYVRVDLKEKRSKMCKKEHSYYQKACKEVDRELEDEKDEFMKLLRENEDINVRNTQNQGRLFLVKAAALEHIGEVHEERDYEHGNEVVRATLVQKVETKTVLIEQGTNKTGQEIMTAFSRTSLKIPE